MFECCRRVQDDQQISWLHDDPHCLSSLERQCQQKDTLINQLYHQLGTLQQQQHAGDATRLIYPGTDTSNVDVGQKLIQLEREVVAKRLEVEDLRAKVQRNISASIRIAAQHHETI